MMNIQRIRLSENCYSWLVLGDDQLPVVPIQEFIRFLECTEKSPNTIRAYANHLKLFWEFLSKDEHDWRHITINHLSRFIHWLRSYQSNVIHLSGKARRVETTVNCIIACLSSFYRYHKQVGHTQVEFTEPGVYANNKYRSFMHHVHKHKTTHKKIISLKPTKSLPKTLSENQIKMIFTARVNIRDQLLLRLLYETGLRIGQALGLQHQDIQSWDNLIQIIPNNKHINGARTKSQNPYVVHVSQQLIQLYTDYISQLMTNPLKHQYVFVNLKTFEPINYGAVRQLFCRLSKKLGCSITPHMFRHTHATALIRQGWDASLVQKRLGHASVQTTLDIYSHLDNQDLKNAYQDFLNTKRKE